MAGWGDGPVLDWEPNPTWNDGRLVFRPRFHHYDMRLSVGPAMGPGDGWEWGHGTGSFGPFPDARSAQLAAEAWLRERLAPFAPLFATAPPDG